MSAPLLVTAEEINCLIFAYLQDSGFQHAAFAIRMEGKLDQTPHFNKHIPRGELVELLSKALLYVEVEAHWKADAMTTNCKTGFSLLETHVCSLDPKAKSSSVHKLATTTTARSNEQTNGDPGNKRKADEPTKEDTPVEKRAKRNADDMDVDSTTTPVESTAKSKSKEPPPSAPVPNSPVPSPVKTSDLVSKPKSKLLAGPIDDTPQDAWSLLTGHKSEIFVTSWNPLQYNLLATGSKDGIVHIWDIPMGSVTPRPDTKPLKISYFSKQEQGDLTSLDWNYDGSLLAIGSYDSILRVCTSNGKLYFSQRTHQGPIFAAKFNKSGTLLVSASLDGTSALWDIKSKKLVLQYCRHADCCLDVEWLNEETFASCGADHMIHLLSTHNQRTSIKMLSGHKSEVNQIKANPSKTRLASCSDDQTARIWNISEYLGGSPDSIPGLNQSDPILLQGHEHSVSSVAWCPRLQPGGIELIATASFDKTIRLWNSATGQCLKIFQDHNRPVYALTFSPDGRWLGSGSGDGWLHLYSIKSSTKKWTWYAGADKPGVFEISWQQTATVNRIAVALERYQPVVIDLTKVKALQDDS